MITVNGKFSLIEELEEIILLCDNKDENFLRPPIDYLKLVYKQVNNIKASSYNIIKVMEYNPDFYLKSTIRNSLSLFNSEVFYSWIHKSLIIESEHEYNGRHKEYKYSKMINLNFNKLVKLENLFLDDLSEDEFNKKSEDLIIKSIKSYCKKYIKQATKDLMDDKIMELNLDQDLSAAEILWSINSHKDLVIALNKKDDQGQFLLEKKMDSIYRLYNSKCLYPMKDIFTSKNLMSIARDIINNGTNSEKIQSNLVYRITSFYSLTKAGYKTGNDFATIFEKARDAKKALELLSPDEILMAMGKQHNLIKNETINIINDDRKYLMYEDMYNDFKKTIK